MRAEQELRNAGNQPFHTTYITPTVASRWYICSTLINMTTEDRPETKRNHIVPREYLQWFESASSLDTSSFVWMYDKNTRRWTETSIQNAGVRRRYYRQEDEDGLAIRVEGPAQEPLRKLREGKSLDFDERVKVSWYLYAMIARVPMGRASVKKIIEETSEQSALETFEEVRVMYDTLGSPMPDGVRRYMDELLEKIKENPFDIPLYQDLEAQVFYHLGQEEVPDTAQRILPNLSWRVITMPRGQHFVTSDNPVHVFDLSGGSDNDLFELTMPLSSTRSLHISRQGTPRQLEFIPANRILMRTLNIRSLSRADRFVFSSRKAKWVEQILHRPSHMNRTHHLGWGEVPVIKGFYRGPVCDKCGTVFTEEQVSSAEVERLGRMEGDSITIETNKTIWHNCQT